MAKENFDFIIVGGGSAGCVLANRLSANPDHKVLLLEAGPVDHRMDFRIHMPAALTYPLTSKTYNWWYESDPEPFMHHRRIYHPRGKALGGSSCINGMIFIRGNAMDFEKWAQNDGLENWDYAHCLPYFQRLETRQMGSDGYRGASGPLYLKTPKCDNPLQQAFFQAVQQAGYPLTNDVNGYQQEGFSAFDATIYRGRRWNAARAYLHPIKNRSHLSVVTRAHGLRVLFSKNRAVGVEYKCGSSVKKAYGNETILCGGAFNTPQILQLSGIGSPKLLQRHGIAVQCDLPGVGENLQDHLELYVQWACKQPVSLYPHLKYWRQPKIGAEWLFKRRGIGASNHFEAGGFIRSNDTVPYPNLQFHFLPLAIRYDGSAPASGHGFQLHVGPMNSDVRGSVKIKSSDPMQHPSIQFNYLSTPQERKEWVEAIHCARKIVETKAFDPFRGEELAPTQKVQTEAEIIDFVAKEGESAYHPSCTCKMGYDPMAVVDRDLKVHQLEKLRVVDASVMPSITNGNIYAPVLMIAEKASDVILGNTPLPASNLKFYQHKPEAL